MDLDPHAPLNKLLRYIDPAFHTKYHWIEKVIGIWADSRMFHEEKQHGNCSGQHDEAVAKTVDHNEFGCWLRDVKSQIMAIVDGGHSEKAPNGNLTIVTFCRQGNNRSVSTAFLLVGILKSLGIFVVGRPTYLSMPSWKRKSICLLKCKNCQADTAEKKHAIDKAIGYWHRF